MKSVPNDGIEERYTFRGGLTRCEMLAPDINARSVGWARLNEGDKYNRTIGMAIASTRAAERMAPKIRRALVKMVQPDD